MRARCRRFIFENFLAFFGYVPYFANVLALYLRRECFSSFSPPCVVDKVDGITAAPVGGETATVISVHTTPFILTFCFGVLGDYVLSSSSKFDKTPFFSTICMLYINLYATT